MAQPTVKFLCVAIANALLAHYGVERPPVPVRDFLRTPPPDLTNELSLIEALSFGEAMYIRGLSGQGTVFSNPNIPGATQRVALARALFLGLCNSRGGQAAGLPSAKVLTSELHNSASYFARCLLMPEWLLPEGWETMRPEPLAELFDVPVPLVEHRIQELRAAN
jgi:hypothetical protein